MAGTRPAGTGEALCDESEAATNSQRYKSQMYGPFRLALLASDA